MKAIWNSVGTAGPQVSVKTQQESVRRGESVTLRCEAEGDAPLDLSWRARDSRVDPNYDVRFVSKLIKPLPSHARTPQLALRTIDESDTSISHRSRLTEAQLNYTASPSRQADWLTRSCSRSSSSSSKDAILTRRGGQEDLFFEIFFGLSVERGSVAGIMVQDAIQARFSREDSDRYSTLVPLHEACDWAP